MTKPICTIDDRTGYLDHLARVGVDLRASVRMSGSMNYVDGQIADMAGTLALRELATELGVPIFVLGASDYHAGATFTPRTAQGTEAQRAETAKQGSVHDGPVANGDAPKGD